MSNLPGVDLQLPGNLQRDPRYQTMAAAPVLSGVVVPPAEQSPDDGRQIGVDPNKPGQVVVYSSLTTPPFVVDYGKLTQSSDYNGLVQQVRARTNSREGVLKGLAELQNSVGNHGGVMSQPDYSGQVVQPYQQSYPQQPVQGQPYQQNYPQQPVQGQPYPQSYPAGPYQSPGVAQPAPPPQPVARPVNWPISASPPPVDPMAGLQGFLETKLAEMLQASKNAERAQEKPPETAVARSAVEPRFSRKQVLIKQDRSTVRATFHSISFGENCLVLGFDTMDTGAQQFSPELGPGDEVITLHITLPDNPVEYTVGYAGMRFSLGKEDYLIFLPSPGGASWKNEA